MRCLVTGAAGFLGSHLLSRLLQSGNQVIILIRPTTDPWRIQRLLSETQIIRGDLSRVREVKEQIIAARPDVVFHLAWAGGSSGRHQNDMTQIADNLPGSLSLLHIASQAGARRWIGVGSAFEYGDVAGVLTEASLPQPNTLYAISKYSLCLASAKACALLGMEYIWARPFAIYGTEDDPHGLIPFVVRTLLQGERPSLTAGEQAWDYLHVEDAAHALFSLALSPDARGVYNVASGTGQTIRRLVEMIRDLINPKLPLGFGEIPYHPDQIMNLRADVSKIKAAARWSPEIALTEGLRGVIGEVSEELSLGLKLQ